VFGQRQAKIEQTIEARREKIGPKAAWEMIRKKEAVVIAKGKKRLTFVPDEKNREEILKAAMGRSGSLRAPSIDTGEKMIIGFNEGIYEDMSPFPPE